MLRFNLDITHGESIQFKIGECPDSDDDHQVMFDSSLLNMTFGVSKTNGLSESMKNVDVCKSYEEFINPITRYLIHSYPFVEKGGMCYVSYNCTSEIINKAPGIYVNTEQASKTQSVEQWEKLNNLLGYSMQKRLEQNSKKFIENYITWGDKGKKEEIFALNMAGIQNLLTISNKFKFFEIRK